MSRRAVVYARISDDRAGAGLGVARQERECRELCDAKGWTVVDVLVDNDRSAYSGKRRPSYERLMAGLKGGLYDVVVAWHPDRLHRSPKELEAFIDALEAAGASAATATAGEWDLSTAAGRMTARVVGAVARHESEHKSERNRAKHRQLAESGRPNGGERPFGFDADRVSVNADEKAVVQELARMLLDGVSLLGLVRWLNDNGIATARGGRWRATGVHRLLTGPRVGGFRERDGKLHRAVWPPLLDEVTWRRVRTLLEDPARSHRAPRRYLLTGGVAVCALCTGPLVAVGSMSRQRFYGCGRCGGVKVKADPFEDDVAFRLFAHLAELGAAPPRPDPSPIIAELEEADAHLAELSDDYYVHRAVSKGQFRSSSDKLTARIAELRAQAAEIERGAVGVDLVGDPATLSQRWGGLQVDQQRAIVDAYVEAVQVGPAVRGRNFYDDDRVEVRWI